MYAKTGNECMSYPSDINLEKFEIIREELETFSKRTSPRKYDFYDVFNALLYVLSTGFQWRALPKEKIIPNGKMFTATMQNGVNPMPKAVVY